MNCCNNGQKSGLCGEGDCVEMGGVYPMIGKRIPDIEVGAYYNGEEQMIKVSDYKGKWVILFFYPADFTFICPTELEEMAEQYETFQKLNTEVLSVSTDTVYTHKAWHDTSEAVKKIVFPMLADRTGALSRALGVYIPEEGNALRGTFIVNPDGEIVSMEVNNNSIGRSAKELIRKLQAAQFVAVHGGKVCPASWQPGDDTLEPGMDLVGKI